MKQFLFLLTFLIAFQSLAQTQICDGNPISVSASGFHTGSGFEQLYVLVDNATGNIVFTNTTGNFTQADYGAGNFGDYSVYAVNTEDATVNTEMNGNGLWITAQTNANGTCTDIIGPQAFSIVDCTPIEICSGENIVQTASGFHTGSGFEQIYVLVDENTGNIVSSNNTGTFNETDYGVGTTGTFLIYAVNTDDATLITELNGTGSWTNAETNANSLCADIIGPIYYSIILCCDLDVTSSITHESCANSNDGEVEITVNGSDTYDIFVDGSATPTHNDINAGTYTISSLADGNVSIQIVDINDASCDTVLNLTINAGNSPTTPTFNVVGPFCSGETINSLPTTSTNTVSGSWSPAIDNSNTTTYTFTPNSSECATTADLTISINPIYSISENVNACENSSYTFPDGSNLTITGNTTYTSNLQTSLGCDSIITTNVTMTQSLQSTINTSICQGGDYTYADGSTSTNIQANESNISTLISSSGCDSVVTENITVDAPITNSITIDLCSGQNYTYADGTISNNITVNESHISNLTNSNGCDSILTENVNIVAAITSTINTSICQGGDYTYADGSTSTNIQANESNVSTLIASSGCDSVVTENITVDTAYDLISNISVCENELYTYPDGTTSTITGNETQISSLTSSTGCDSTITTNITMNPTYDISSTVTVCIGSSYTYPDGTVSNNIQAAESHTSNLATVNSGCDSIITINISISNQFTSDTDYNICSGNDFTYADGTTSTNITINESYTSTFISATGCDSLVTQNLIIQSVYTNTIDVDVCENTNYTFPDGSSISVTGSTSNTSTFTTGFGCDSIIITNITMIPNTSSIENINVCENTNYTFPDGFTMLITSNTTHQSDLTASTGCDSTIVTNITMISNQTSNQSITVCSGADFTYADGTISTNITANESYSSTFQSVLGCDSIIIENLTVTPSITNSINADVCFNGTYTYADGTISNNIIANESHISNLLSINGCDSILTENLNVLPEINITQNIEICEGADYTFSDGTLLTNITTNQSQTSTLLSSNGCDSIVTENLILKPIYTIQENFIICENESYTFPDGTISVITNNTTYTSNLNTISGCDSIIVTTITMNPIDLTIENISVCENTMFTYPDGTTSTITAIETHTSTFISINGCDSIIETTVTPIQPFQNTLNLTVCYDASFTFADGTEIQNITSAVSYTSNFTTIEGCDSIIIENINPLPELIDTIFATICSGEDYSSVFGGASFTNVLADFSHTTTVNLSNGCDSIYVEYISVLPPTSIDFGSDLSICAGSTVTISPNFNGDIPIWSTGDTTSSIIYTATSDTFFIASTSTICGIQTDTIFIVVDPGPGVDAGQDETIPLGAQIDLEATSNDPFVSFLWTPDDGLSCSNCPNPTASIIETTPLIVTATDENGCSSTDTIYITIDGEIEVFIPNVFSPNGDFQNDVFKVYGPQWESYKMEIYNRWGGLIWQSEDPNEEWTGLSKNGEECPQAVFVYKFWGVSTVGLSYEKAGNVMLTR